MRHAGTGRWFAVGAVAAMGVAGCSLMDLFDEAAPESCEPGLMRRAPCGLCGNSTGIEVCGPDGTWSLDSCDPDPDDVDGDLAAATACGSEVPVDCDDGAAAVHPGATEACNAVDDDCDGATDEDFECAAGEAGECTSCEVTGRRSCAASCRWDRCSLLPGGGACKIDGTCHVEAERDLLDPCRLCISAADPAAWTRVCWHDEVSGLVWEDPLGAGPMGWDQAVTYCNALSAGEYTDWRLPTISELRSFIRGCPDTMTGGACGVTDACLDQETCSSASCRGCRYQEGPGADGCFWDPAVLGTCSTYWSSSYDAPTTIIEWIVYFDFGWVSTGSDPGTSLVRCVRGP